MAQNNSIPQVCPVSGQLIEAKPVKYFGLSLFHSTIVGILILSTIVLTAASLIDDEKTKRHTLVQGSIAIACALVYGTYLHNVEKSKSKISSANKTF